MAVEELINNIKSDESIPQLQRSLSLPNILKNHRENWKERLERIARILQPPSFSKLCEILPKSFKILSLAGQETYEVVNLPNSYPCVWNSTGRKYSIEKDEWEIAVKIRDLYPLNPWGTKMYSDKKFPSLIYAASLLRHIEEGSEVERSPATSAFSSGATIPENTSQPEMVAEEALSISANDLVINEYKLLLEKLGDTEILSLGKQRVGQDLFRKRLIDYWGNCAISGLKNQTLLRASHAKPWADCETDAERLDVFNGFLLSANFDALFDAGLMTIEDSGKLVFSEEISPQDCEALQLNSYRNIKIELRPEHLKYLAWHREHVFKNLS